MALSGQSNAVNLRPFLSRYATVVGSSWSGAPLSFWDLGGPAWAELQPTLSPAVTRFVWFQGESDADYGVTPGAPLTSTYRARFSDFIARVRALTRPNLFVVVCGLENYADQQVAWDVMRGEQQRWVAADSNAVYISTIDLPNNGEHLTDAGYEILAARVAAAAAPADASPVRVPPTPR